MIWKSYFRDNFLFFILTTLLIIISVVSFYRFMIKHDYMVSYEGTCNPVNNEKCFVGCEDDACTIEYYYTKMLKYEPDLLAECGKDITDCETANICLPNDSNCSVTYCDPEIDGEICKVPVNEIETDIQSDSHVNFSVDDSLQSFKINSSNL